MNHSIRNLVVDLLDDEHGIETAKFESLMKFVEHDYPGICEDIWGAVDGAENRVYLNEDVAENLRD